jgi:hypothetical protein
MTLPLGRHYLRWNLTRRFQNPYLFQTLGSWVTALNFSIGMWWESAGLISMVMGGIMKGPLIMDITESAICFLTCPDTK